MGAALKVRKLGPEAKAVADRWFLENFVRIHRAGEGASYDGLKPSGTGDNRAESTDSRSFENPYIAVSNIKAKVVNIKK